MTHETWLAQFFNHNFAGVGNALLGMVNMKAVDPAALAHIRKNLPFYIFAGDKDPINADLTRLLPLVERYREAGISDITTDFYSGGRHEMLNETNRDEVVANLKAWIERVIV